MGQLRANGKEVTHEATEDEGNIIVINTCGFIDKSLVASCVTSFPLARSCPIKTSLSYTFLEQPKVMTLILFFFKDLVLIVFVLFQGAKLIKKCR